MQKITKSLLLAGMATLFSINANATICPYTDHFIIKAPFPISVLHSSTEGNITFTQISNNYFRLGCADTRNASGGNVHVDIGMDELRKCHIDIHDGPFVSNPTVTHVDCGGANATIYFIGMEHQYGTYDYVLNFTM